MLYLGVDPGQTKSAYVLSEEYKPIRSGKIDNTTLREMLVNANIAGGLPAKMLIEIPVGRKWSGKSVSETALWAGIFISAWVDWLDVAQITRSKVRMNLCGRSGNDSKIRAYLIERFDPDNFESIKIKKGDNKGKHKYYLDRGSEWFAGFADDVWQAYALTVYYLDSIGGANVSGTKK